MGDGMRKGKLIPWVVAGVVFFGLGQIINFFLWQTHPALYDPRYGGDVISARPVVLLFAAIVAYALARHAVKKDDSDDKDDDSKPEE
jgi:phosphotransferase system  glucose/maltose/N-acetylglucosamine-specific IIC component